jgi:hypothetical protein
MTTQLAKDSNPRLPRPSEYTAFSNRVLSAARPALPRHLPAMAFVLALVGLGLLILSFAL